MNAERRAQGIRQTPKHLEKMLFVNHREEQGLQRRLDAIATDSRLKGRALDRERIKVRNESRFTSRLNYQHVAPLLDKIPTLIHREMNKQGYTVESVNDYILREYRRNSSVIPSILSSLNKEMNKEDINPPEKEELITARKQSSLAKSTSGLTPRRKQSEFLQKPTIYNNNVTSEDSRENTDYEAEEINPRRITNLVKDIAKIRNEMFANKKIDIARSRVSFPELLRSVQDRDKRGSDSDTYTDGTCVLLRRKMQKIRKHTAPDPDLEVYTLLGQGATSGSVSLPAASSKPPRKRLSAAQPSFHSQTPQLPSINSTKGATTMSSIARQSILENDEKELKRQLDEQERQQTEMKVAIETRKYQHLQKRVNDFLQKTQKRPALPLLYETEIG